MLDIAHLHDVPVSRGRQHLGDFRHSGSTLGQPLMKERVLLQVGRTPGLGGESVKWQQTNLSCLQHGMHCRLVSGLAVTCMPDGCAAQAG